MNASLTMPRPAAPSIWRAALVRLAAVEVALLLMFASDVADLVGVWTADATYNHCVLVAPIVAVLVWLRRRELCRLTPGRLGHAARLGRGRRHAVAVRASWRVSARRGTWP